MKKFLPALAVAFSMALGGYYLAPHGGQSAAGDVTCATATATVPPITYSDGGTRSGTIPGASDTSTVCVTEPSPTLPPPPPLPPPTACTYYVSPSGADTNPGTQVAPWQTASKVNNATLAAGNVVCFQGGASFANLAPSSSGTASSPIIFKSYGTGKALFTNGVWVPDARHDQAYENLDLSSQAGGVFASSGSGSGTFNIVLRDSFVHDSPYAGVNVLNTNDHDQLIENNTFHHLGDSCLLIGAPSTVIRGNTISDCGFNTALNYGKHGIYAKAANLTISGNEIAGPISTGSGISLRKRGELVSGNTIHDLGAAISYFAEDTTAGLNKVYNNRLWNIKSWFFYYGANTVTSANSPVDFVIASNTVLLLNASEGMNLSEEVASGTTVANNIFSGTFGSAYRGCAKCSEHHNDWNGGTSNIPSGTGDLRVAPNLSAAPELKPLAGSPVIDKGSPTVTGLNYVAVCDAQPLHYCGLAPDMGAVEGA